MNSLPNDPWKEHSRRWSSVGKPLRPSFEDIAFTRSAISEWLRRTHRTAPTLLILGVTPELCSLPMNSGSRFIAVDKSAEMIGNLWRPRPGVWDEVICADWRHMPLASSSVDIALGDGSLSMLQYPSEYATVFSNLRRVLRPRNRCIIRCFMQGGNRETIDEVFADLSRGRIGNFHVLKWRLMMALQPDAEKGVAVRAVWSIMNETWPDLNLLAERFAWPVEQVLTLSAYRNVDTRYTFPTRAQYCHFFTSVGFSVIQVSTQSYELGDRCPTFVLERLTSEATR
jgi:SAM-dependent methyltransferase